MMALMSSTATANGTASAEFAIRLRGAVKRYGSITAVDGLDLDVPTGTCVGLLGPNGAGKSTTMRLLTAQAIADEGEIAVLGFQLPEQSKMARAQCGVVPQLDNLDTTLTVEQNLLVFAHLYRISRTERRGAIERALEMAQLGDRRDSRVDKLSGGMRRRLLIARALVHRPRLVLLDEPTVGLDPQVRQELWALIDALRTRRDDDPDVDALHRRGRAPGRHRPDHVARQGGRRRVARRARGHARRPRGARGLRRARPAWPRSRRKRQPPGSGRVARARASRSWASTTATPSRSRASGGPPNLEDVFVLLTGEEIPDGAITAPAAQRRLRRLERPALTGVLVREVVNFSSYWKSATFSSTVEPTIYLLAFGFGFGSLVSRIGGYRYVEFVGTGTVATAVLFSSAFPAMFGTFVKYQFQRTYDAILAAPVDTEELVTAEALWIASRAGVYGCVPMLVAISFGLNPSWGMLTVPLIAWIAGFGWACFGDHDRRLRQVDRELQLRRQCGADAALPRRRNLLPAQQPARLGAVPREPQPAPPLRRARPPRRLRVRGWSDLARVGALVLFGLIMWRVAIPAMTRKLID